MRSALKYKQLALVSKMEYAQGMANDQGEKTTADSWNRIVDKNRVESEIGLSELGSQEVQLTARKDPETIISDGYVELLKWEIREVSFAYKENKPAHAFYDEWHTSSRKSMICAQKRSAREAQSSNNGSVLELKYQTRRVCRLRARHVLHCGGLSPSKKDIRTNAIHCVCNTTNRGGRRISPTAKAYGQIHRRRIPQGSQHICPGEDPSAYPIYSQRLRLCSNTHDEGYQEHLKRRRKGKKARISMK